jgi:hypothetical protein
MDLQIQWPRQFGTRTGSDDMTDDIHFDDVFVRIVDDEGNVSGVMDHMTADYLASTDPDPTQASLDAAFDGVTRVRLVGFRHDDRTLVYDVLRLDVTDPNSLAELVAALRITEADEYGHWMSIGDHHLELWAGDRHVHTLELLHWTAIRRSVWKGDADFAEPWHFANWLLRHGIPDARDCREEDEQREAEWQRHMVIWERAMPSSLRPLWPDRLDNVDRDLDAARSLLEAAMPDPIERVRALYAWFGSDSQPWSGFYSHEKVPEWLLLEYPIDALLAAVDTRTSSEAAVLGAARLFVGWDFDRTRKADLTRCSEPLREHMLHAVQRQGIAENLRRFRSAFDLPDP